MSLRQFIKLMLGIALICVLFLLLTIINEINAIKIKEQNNHFTSDTIKFPMNYCGDYSAGGFNTWYYVYINYNQSDLTNIRNNFCCDAYYNKSNNTIIVASFYNKNRASNFVKVLNNKGFKDVNLGGGQKISVSRSPQRRYSCH